MKRRLVCLIFVILTVTVGLTPTTAQETQTVPEKPELAVRIIPPEPYLQEQIIQTVRVVAAHVFEELVLDLPPIEGADVITLQQPKTRKFATYGGEGYIYETKRAIFPRSSGKLHIPTVRVSGSVGISKDEQESFALKSKPVVLDIQPPPAEFSENAWLVARKVEIKEHWSKPTDDLRIGDHVTRTIEAKVTGATGSHLPELIHGRSTGLTILPGQTERETDITPNEVIGKISRSFELRIDTDQPINISPVRMVWWNTDTEIEWRSAAKSVRIEPLPRDVDNLVQQLMVEANQAQTTGRYGVLALSILGGLALAVLMAWLVLTMRNRTPEDRILLEAVRSNPDPIKAVAALLHWGEKSFAEDRPMSLERLSAQLDPDAEKALTELQQSAFGEVDRAIDSVAITKTVIAAARNKRGRNLIEIGTDALRYLLGPKRHLPNV